MPLSAQKTENKYNYMVQHYRPADDQISEGRYRGDSQGQRIKTGSKLNSHATPTENKMSLEGNRNNHFDQSENRLNTNRGNDENRLNTNRGNEENRLNINRGNDENRLNINTGNDENRLNTNRGNDENRLNTNRGNGHVPGSDQVSIERPAALNSEDGDIQRVGGTKHSFNDAKKVKTLSNEKYQHPENRKLQSEVFRNSDNLLNEDDRHHISPHQRQKVVEDEVMENRPRPNDRHPGGRITWNERLQPDKELQNWHWEDSRPTSDDYEGVAELPVDHSSPDYNDYYQSGKL